MRLAGSAGQAFRGNGLTRARVIANGTSARDHGRDAPGGQASPCFLPSRRTGRSHGGIGGFDHVVKRREQGHLNGR